MPAIVKFPEVVLEALPNFTDLFSCVLAVSVPDVGRRVC